MTEKLFHEILYVFPTEILTMNKRLRNSAGKDAPMLNELSDFLKNNPDYSLVKPNAVNSVKAEAKTPSSER